MQNLAQEDFPPKLLRNENADFKFSVNNEGEDVNLHCGKPRFLSLPVSPPIYRSTSAKLVQYYGPKYNNFQANCTAISALCFCLFLNPDAEIMLNLLLDTLLTITPHETQKRRRRKERTTYGPLRRYSRLVTHPVLNPNRQGLTWVPLPNRVSRRLLRDTYF